MHIVYKVEYFFFILYCLADTTPIEDILNFKEDFENKYGRTHPTFYEGSYGQAIEDAKKELRFLLVYLHSSEHKDTEQFCRFV